MRYSNMFRSATAICTLVALGTPMAMAQAPITLPSISESVGLAEEPAPAAEAPAESGASISISGVQPRPAEPVGPVAEAAPPGDEPISLFGPRIDLIRSAETAEEEVNAFAAPDLAVSGLWPREIGEASGTSYRFTTESDVAEFTLFAPRDDLPRTLEISTISSAFVQPEGSSLTVSVGETVLGEIKLDKIAEQGNTTLAIPAGVIQQGRNIVRIEADQRHRHFCGEDANYDLWTSLDLRKSGISYDPALLGSKNSSFLAALASARSEGLTVKIRRQSEGVTDDMVLEVVRSLGRSLGGGLRFRLVDGPVGNAGHGPEVLLSKDTTAGVEFDRGPGGNQIMFVQIGESVPDLISELGAPFEKAPTPFLPQGIPVEITSLGLGNVQISDHLWQQSAEFRLPEDWLIETNEQAELRLDFAYISGLPKGARLRFVVNGRAVRLIPLDTVGRQSTKLLPVRFDARFLHAGRNVIGFEVGMPGNPNDEPCPDTDLPMVEIGSNSLLTVPPSPRMHMPGLNRAMSGISTASLRSVRDNEGNTDLQTLLALASLLPAESEAAADLDTRLIVLGPEDLNPSHFGDFLLAREVVIGALQRSAPDPEGIGTSIADRIERRSLFSVVPSGADGAVDVNYIIGEVSGLVTEAVAPLKRYALPDGPRDLTEWIADKRAQAVLFQLDSATPETMYLVLGQNADVDQVAEALARTTDNGAPLDGHAAVLGRDGRWETWQDQTRVPVLEEEISLMNWHGVVGNYASSRPMSYVSGLILMAVISVIVAVSYVSSQRGRR